MKSLNKKGDNLFPFLSISNNIFKIYKIKHSKFFYLKLKKIKSSFHILFLFK